MRIKLIIFFLIPMIFGGAVHAENKLLEPSIDVESMSAFVSPTITKKHFSFKHGEYLFVTQDYGFGLELREIYLYRKNNNHWSLEAFARTRCSSPTLSYKKNRFIVSCQSKAILVWSDTREIT